MKKLKKVGFFRELPHGDENGDCLMESMNKHAIANLSSVIGYLEKGHLLIVSPTVLTDVLSDEQKHIGTLAILTDGVWAWPSDLAYYVKNYRVSLPQKFLRHIYGNKWDIVDVNIDDLML